MAVLFSMNVVFMPIMWMNKLCYFMSPESGKGKGVGWSGVGWGEGGGRGAKLPYIVPLCYEFEV